MIKILHSLRGRCLCSLWCPDGVPEKMEGRSYLWWDWKPAGAARASAAFSSAVLREKKRTSLHGKTSCTAAGRSPEWSLQCGSDVDERKVKTLLKSFKFLSLIWHLWVKLVESWCVSNPPPPKTCESLTSSFYHTPLTHPTQIRRLVVFTSVLTDKYTGIITLSEWFIRGVKGLLHMSTWSLLGMLFWFSDKCLWIGAVWLLQNTYDCAIVFFSNIIYWSNCVEEFFFSFCANCPTDPGGWPRRIPWI